MATGTSQSVQVHYPQDRGRIVLRTEDDWERDIEPSETFDDVHVFDIETDQPFFYFKPLLANHGQWLWSQGQNYLALADGAASLDVYPHFDQGERCSVCDVQTVAAQTSGASHQFRVFLPPGYYENPLRRYPVLYMKDGQNLFFADEAFGGAHWQVQETLNLLDSMSAIDQVIVVGIYPEEREREYTASGYEDYGRFIVAELKPHIDANYRTKDSPQTTAVMGSSLGGVASLYLGWQYPDVFGMVGCLSATLGWRDDLFERIANEPRRDLRIYLDSGWPRDNYEVTRNMYELLRKHDYALGSDLMYFAFPNALHNERAWAMRSHIPYQFFFGTRFCGQSW